MAFALISKPVTGKRAGAATPVVQQKLKVGEANDRFEQEADRVAEDVMSMSGNATGTPVQNSPASIQRMCGACAKEDEQKVRRKPAQPAPQISSLDSGFRAQLEGLPPSGDLSNTMVGAPVEQSIRDAHNKGSALPSSTRQFLEPRFGRDLSGIRIHADRASGALAQRLQSRAFTVGSDIFFAPGEFQPHTPAGLRVLSHELTHAAQQGAVQSTASSVGPGVSAGGNGTVQREVAHWRIEPASKVLDKIQDIAKTNPGASDKSGPAVANLKRLIALGLGFNPGSDPSERKNSFVYTCNCGWIDMGHFFISAAAAYIAAYLESSVQLNVNQEQQTPNKLMAEGMKKARPYLEALLKTVATGDKGPEILAAVDRLLAAETPTGAGLALGYGMEFYQQIVKLIADRTANPGDFLKGSQRSAFTMEDLPSDCYGVDFGRDLWGKMGNARLDSLPHREMMEKFFAKCGAVYPTGKDRCVMMNETTPGTCTMEGGSEHWADGEPNRYTSPNPYLLKSAKSLCPNPTPIGCANAAVVEGKTEGPGEAQLPKARVDISTKAGTAAITTFEDFKLPGGPLIPGGTIVGVNKRGRFFGATSVKLPQLGKTDFRAELDPRAGKIHATADAGSIVQVNANATLRIDFKRLFQGLFGTQTKQLETIFRDIISSSSFKTLLISAVTGQISMSEFTDSARKLLATAEDQLSRQFPAGIKGVIDDVVSRLRDQLALAASLHATGTLTVMGVPTTYLLAHKGVGLQPLLALELGLIPSELITRKRVVAGAKVWVYGQDILQAHLATGYDPMAKKFILDVEAKHKTGSGYELFLNVRGGLALDGNGDIVGAVGARF
jgi:hypothetical protein